MLKKVLLSVKQNKVILFSLAALISFSFTLFYVDMNIYLWPTIIINPPASDDIKTSSHDKVIINHPVSDDIPVHKPVVEAASIPIQASSRGQVSDSIPLPINEYYWDELSETHDSKLYSFVVDEPCSVSVIFTNEKVNSLVVSVYLVDVLNSNNISLIGGEHSILGRYKEFEAGRLDIEAGRYFVRVSQGSVYNSGTYRLWVRK